MEKNIHKEIKLLDEFEKIQKHAHKRSYRTRKRYAQTMRQLIKFLCSCPEAPDRLKDINNFWIMEFIFHQQGLGRSQTTIKTQLAHIRYWHSYIPQARFRLANNDYLFKIAEKEAQEDERELGRGI